MQRRYSFNGGGRRADGAGVGHDAVRQGQHCSLRCPSGHSRATQHGNVDVLVMNGAGVGLGNIPVLVQATTIGAITNLSGRAELSVPEGVHTVVVRVIGCPPQSRTVTVPATGIVDVVIQTECAPQFDKVVTGATSSELIALLDLGVDVSGTAACQNDFAPPLQGIGSVIVPGNATAADAAGAACHLALLLLAHDRAPTCVNGAAEIPWTSALGDAVSATVPPT
ncbi:MAG: hypothetical protein IPP90_16180 [Gemmatimonadaceae bacterium]|nr:hypothetical protein [Gemmatimonadaceae bacterium]